jgi:hypothetical protein
MSDAQIATTENVLHPRQVSELTEEKRRLERVFEAPSYVRAQLQDGGANIAKQIREVDRVLAQSPRPYGNEDIDAAHRAEAELRANWLEGMPTQAEMRRNPPGAVDRHRRWEKAKKNAVLKWKQVRRRLHATGVSVDRLSDESDISNIEMYRPAGGPQELSMDNAQIPVQRTVHLPPVGAGPTAVMSDEDGELLGRLDPELRESMAVLDNDARARVLEYVRSIKDGVPPAADAAPKKRGRKKGSTLSPEARQRSAERLRAYHEKRRAEKAALAEEQRSLAASAEE